MIESSRALVYLPIHVPFSLKYHGLHSVQFSAPRPEQVDLQATLHAVRKIKMTDGSDYHQESLVASHH